MPKDKPVVAVITYSIKRSDGTWESGTDILPGVILSNIMVDMLSWKERWSATFEEAEEYFKEEAEVIKTL